MDKAALEAYRHREFIETQRALRAERWDRVEESFRDASNVLVATVTMGTMETGKPKGSFVEASAEDLQERVSRESLGIMGGLAAVQVIERGYDTTPVDSEKYAVGYAESN
jgi:hypothetical protein